MATIANVVFNFVKLLDWRFPEHLLTQDECDALARLSQVAKERLQLRAERYYQTGALPVESYKDLSAAGLLALTIPKKYGGKKFSPLAFIAAMLELGQANPVVANTINMHYVVLWFLSKLATPQQKAYLFPFVTDCGALFAASTSEPGIRWDDPNGTMLYTTVKQLPTGDYLLNGEKWRTSMANTASFRCVAAVLEGYSPKNGLVIVVVPKDTPGEKIIDDWPPDMMWSTDSRSIQFNDCVIPASHVVGKPGELPESGLFALFALGYASFYLGMGLSGFLAFVQEYGSDEYDVAIGNIALSLNRALKVLTEAAIAWQNKDKECIPLATAHAKAYCPEVAYEVLRQINDLVGESKEPYNRLLVDAQAAQFMPPSPKLVATRVGQAVRQGTAPRFLGFRGS